MPQLTFTRFIVAFLIVVFHFGSLLCLDHKILQKFLNFALSGVSYFFLLSGFILTYVYDNKIKKISDSKKFFLARIARIYPVYLLALILLITFLFLTKQQIPIKDLVLQIFLLHAWFPKHSLVLNEPAWSLSVEMFFYLLFPFILIFFKKIKKEKNIYIMGFSFWFISQFIYIFLLNYLDTSNNECFHSILFYNPLLHLNTFVFGIVSYFLFKKLSPILQKFNLALFFLSILIILILILTNSPIIKNSHNGLLSPIFILIIFSLANNSSSLKIFASRQLQKLGEVSYSIYILQVPLYFWWGALLKKLLIENLYIKFFTYLLFLILSSFISYIFIETPFRKYIKKYPK